MLKKNSKTFDCSVCDFSCSTQTNYNTHLVTRKHIIRTELNENKPSQVKLECIPCDFNCSKQSNYNAHLLTKKHSKLIQQIVASSTIIYLNPNSFTCSKCNKKYKARNSLWYHEQKCNNVDSKTENVILDIKHLIIEVMKNNTEIVKSNSELQTQYTELQKQNAEIQKQLLDVCKNSSNMVISNNNNNNNNKTFNLQFFLNEQCKDAMNITDFANSIDLQLEDLESVGELGYVDGITKIIVDKLNTMDIYKRPMHCSDAKREIIYVKDENIWTKEGPDAPKLRQAIKNVSFRNMKLVYNWSNAYPESKNNQSSLNDTYIKLVLQSTGGSGPIVESETKIIRRIAKEIIIEKMNN